MLSPGLPERLRGHVLRLAAGDPRILTCEFVPGGRTHGVGVPSPLWCGRCGHTQLLHDIAAVIPLAEREARPPLLREVS